MTITILLLAILAGTLIVNKIVKDKDWQQATSYGQFRTYVMVSGLCVIGITAVPNHWLQAILVVLLVNLMRDPLQGNHYPRALPLYLMMLAGVVALPMLTADFVFDGLLGMAMAGCYLAFRCIREWWPNRHAPVALDCGLENSNNVQAVGAVCLTAALGLGWAYGGWWWVLVLPASIPVLMTHAIAHYQHGSFSLSGGAVVLIGVGLFTVPFWIGWWAVVLVLPLTVGILWSIGQAFRHEKWWDSGRIKIWWIMLLAGWWQRGWPVRLLGAGWQSWLPFHDALLTIARKTNRKAIIQTDTYMSTAHNEFVQILFEHGLLALIPLCGYLATSLWDLGHGTREAQAVYLVGVSLCGVACTLHPWTWYHQNLCPVDKDGKPGGMTLFSIGSPTLVWLSFLTVLMVEVIR